jgi:hypothetical protein
MKTQNQKSKGKKNPLFSFKKASFKNGNPSGTQDPTTGTLTATRTTSLFC